MVAYDNFGNTLWRYTAMGSAAPYRLYVDADGNLQGPTAHQHIRRAGFRANVTCWPGRAIPEARWVALREAVADARADAEAVVSAAGGQLGPIIDMTTSPVRSGLPVFSQRIVIRGANATPLTPQEVRVSATVVVRYAYQAGPAR